MADVALPWAGDLNASPVGDVAMSSGITLGQQRILRRLLTNPGDYLWHPDYGAGLGQFIGAPADVSAIRSAIRAQIFQENVVSRLPEPSIEVENSLDGSLYVTIRYVDSSSGLSQVLAFSVSN